jgi:hypothetical protein
LDCTKIGVVGSNLLETWMYVLFILWCALLCM